MIAIVNYGLGNLGSIRNMLRRVGTEALIANQVSEIRTARKLILPGVGSFDRGMQQLQTSGLLDSIRDRVMNDRIPLLGICLGMQMLTRGSEEGTSPGLGWIPARTSRFNLAPSTPLPVPHMGSDTVIPRYPSPLWVPIDNEIRFYFLHSYHVVCDEPGHVLATTTYGYEFASAIRKDNIIGVQFHPEKSHRFGMSLMKAFAEM